MPPIFVACLPGLEELLRAELEQLQIAAPRAVPGGVECAGGPREVARINLASGLATHVLVRIATFPCRHLAHLRKKADEVAWGDVLLPGQAVTVRVTCRQSKLYHSGAVAQRVAEAMAAAADARIVDAGDDDVPAVLVRVDQDVVTLSLDTSGAPLHRRGWRLQGAKAPLREDIAHAVLLATGWDPDTMLVDPMAGSGTLAIEAARMARRIAPGRGRRFAFERTALCDQQTLEQERAALEAQVRAAPAPILASDRDAGAIEAARANAERAGVAEAVTFIQAPLSGAPVLSGDPEAAPRGALVCNPPHGRRIGRGADLRPLYQSLGKLARQLPEAWRVGLCVVDRRLALASGLPLETAFLTTHGGQKVRVLRTA